MDEDALNALLDEARTSNAQHNITGLMLYVEGHFAQVIEGNADDITQLSENIKRDDRHRNLSVKLVQEKEDRSFDTWSMGIRSMSLSTLKDNEKFESINSIADIDTLVNGARSAFHLMREFYLDSIAKDAR